MKDYESSFRLIGITATCLSVDKFQRPRGSDIHPELVESFTLELFFILEPRNYLETIKDELTKKFTVNQVEVISIGGLHPERLCILCKEDVSWFDVYREAFIEVDQLPNSDPFECFESAEMLFKKDPVYFDKILMDSLRILNVMEES